MNSEVNSLFDLYVENNHFSGVGLVKKGEKVLFAQAYGMAHKGFKVPNTIDTMFDTASVTVI